MNDLDLRKKVGQLLMIGFDGTTINDHLRTMIHDYNVSSIILFARNIVNKDQLLKLTNDIQNEAELAGYDKPILISIDQENGLVNRLTSLGFYMPGAMSLGATQNPKYAYEIGETTASQIKELGLNWNLAPVLDINTNPKNPGIGTRSFSDDEKIAGELGANFIKAHNDQNIATSAKHFPGLGSVSLDPHFDLPVINRSLDELKSKELKPFIEAIKTDVSSVMTAHILLPKIIKEDIPVTMSKTILTDLLRKELKFKGVIISDCLEMDAIKEYYGTARGAYESLKAGTDILIISHTRELQIEAIDYIINKIEEGEFTIDEIDEKLARIDKIKNLVSHNQIERKTITDEDLEKIYTDSVTIVKQEYELDKSRQYICLVPDNESRLIGEEAKKDIIQNFKNTAVSELTNIEIVEYDRDNPDKVIGKYHNEDREIILGILKDNIDFYNFKSNIHVISLRSPYLVNKLYEESKTWINTYENTNLAIKVALKSLFGEVKLNGKTPVNLE